MDFVYHVLFPFVRVHLEDYLKHNADSEELRRDLSMLREEHLKDLEQALAPPEWADAPPTRNRIRRALCFLVNGS